MDKDFTLELFAEELPSEVEMAAPAGTWGSASTVGTASCPGSTAGTASSASSFG